LLHLFKNSGWIQTPVDFLHKANPETVVFVCEKLSGALYLLSEAAFLQAVYAKIKQHLIKAVNKMFPLLPAV